MFCTSTAAAFCAPLYARAFPPAPLLKAASLPRTRAVPPSGQQEENLLQALLTVPFHLYFVCPRDQFIGCVKPKLPFAQRL